MAIADEKLREWVVEIRRDLHMYPETLYNEKRTTQKIKDILEQLGIEAHTFDDMTGVIGIIHGKKPGRTLALRADIDALPIQEMNPVPYRSKIEGCMHACGHDAHVSIMLGVARKVVEEGLIGAMEGGVKFLFQPAEEGGAGAKRMIERGVLESPKVDWVLAGHMDPDLPVGVIGVHHGQSHASADSFRLFIRGQGGHGARPHQNVDPIVAGAQFVCALQSVVARNIDPRDTAVLSVCKFASGSTSNVSPEHAELEGTIRAFKEQTRKLLWQRLGEISKGIDRAYGTNSELEIREGYPPCMNSHEVVEFMAKVAKALFSEENVVELPPSTGAEDFAFFAAERPSAIIRIGCSNEAKGLTRPLHSAYFDIDEDSLLIGVQLFSTAVKEFSS